MKLKSLIPPSATEVIPREKLVELESQLKKSPDVFIGDTVICPLKHSFSDGIYVREIFIPAGTILTGKIHKHDHPNFLMSGKVEIATEDGFEVIEGPLAMISKAGTKRALHTLSDTTWITCHANPTNTQDLAELESIVIANSYEELDEYRKAKDKFLSGNGDLNITHCKSDT